MRCYEFCYIVGIIVSQVGARGERYSKLCRLYRVCYKFYGFYIFKIFRYVFNNNIVKT